MRVSGKDLVLDTTTVPGDLGGSISMIADYDVTMDADQDIVLVAERNYLSEGTNGTHTSVGGSAPIHQP